MVQDVTQQDTESMCGHFLVSLPFMKDWDDGDSMLITPTESQLPLDVLPLHIL